MKSKKMQKVNVTVQSYVMVCQNCWFTAISFDNHADRSIYCFNIFFLHTVSDAIYYYEHSAVATHMQSDNTSISFSLLAQWSN